MNKTRGQLISKLQYMKSGINRNLVNHIGYKDIDTICEYLLEDKHIIEKLEKALDKACKHLSDNNELPCYCDNFENYKPLSQCSKCHNEFVDVEKCWKEYFLKEVK